MPFHLSGSIRFYSFQSLQHPHIVQAVFTRRGGLSPAPWDSLNMGGSLGDDPARVAENRVRAFQALGCAPETLFDVWQVHGSRVVCATAPRPVDRPYQKADAILTDRPGVTLFMRFADCVPVLLFDPVKNVVGLVHAGWQGTVKGIVSRAVTEMVRRYGSQAADIHAGIGPAIGLDHYAIGPEVITMVEKAFGSRANQLLHAMDGAVHLNLWEANRQLLVGAGVRYIETAGICTACHLEDWYSHRGEGGRTGRFGALIALR